MLVADALDRRRKQLNLRIEDVVSALDRRGHRVAYSTVAGWFNGQPGVRWRPPHLIAVLDLLGVDLRNLAKEGLPSPDLTARIEPAEPHLTAEDCQAILQLIRSFKS